jgi:hypothetical protein
MKSLLEQAIRAQDLCKSLPGGAEFSLPVGVRRVLMRPEGSAIEGC